MTSTPSPETTTETREARPLVKALNADERGQITNLEPNAAYFVIRKPTRDMTRDRSRELLTDVRSFLNEHKVLTEKQMSELNERYGEPTKSKVKEVRETLERRFDEIAKELETRFERLENDLGFGRKQTQQPADGSTVQPETPGEMPKGDAEETPATAKTPESEATSNASGKKKTTKQKKSE